MAATAAAAAARASAHAPTTRSAAARRRPPSRTLLAFALFGALAAGCTREPRDARGWNLLLVTLDTVRADHLGCYGAGPEATPEIDRLARQGVRFREAEATVPMTLPSHASLLTGLMPPRHGLHQNGAGSLPTEAKPLAEHLTAAGYRTGAFVGSFVLDRRYGLDRGFAEYDDEVPRDPARSQALEAERPGSAVVDRALAWLGRESAAPFFAWVHLYDAHAPYAPPEPFRSRFAGDPYAGEIAAVDAQVGRLLAALDQSGRAARTLVVVVADHGEALGEHGELTHGLLLHGATLRVPLLLRAPGLLAAGAEVVEPTSLVDLAPTLAALLGLPLPAVGLDGRNLAPQLLGRAEPGRSDLYAETEYPRLFGWSELVSVRRRQWRYIEAPHAELFDLATDPGETRNLLKAEGAKAGELARRVAELRRDRREAAPATLDDEARARLASLGYVTGTQPEQPPDRRLENPKEMVDLFRQLEEARAALDEGRLVAAVATLSALVTADPENPVFRGNLGEALRRQGERTRAVPVLRQAVAANPRDAEAWYNLATALQENGRPAEAIVALEEALRLQPARPEAQNALGIALLSSGQVEAARQAFARAAALDPRDPTAANNLGNACRDLGRLDEAETAYRRAIALAPRYADPLNGLATLAVQRDRPDLALPLFDRALALAPERLEIHLNRGIALELAGDRAGAAASYRRFLDATRDQAAYSEQREAAAALLARLGASASPG